MRKTVWFPILAVLLNIPAFGSIVYSNIATDTGDTLALAANGFTQLGDQIKLAGTDRLATLATIQLFNLGTSGTFDATLRFFNVGSPVGAQIGSDFVLTGVAAPSNDVLNLSFLIPSIAIPDDLIFTVAVGSPSAGVNIVGLDMFEPPTIGLSDNSFAIANNGSTFSQVSTAGENVFFELQAQAPQSVPEPATLGTMLAGLVATVIMGRRAKRGSERAV